MLLFVLSLIREGSMNKLEIARASRQLKINWEKFVGKVIDRAEYNRRNQIVSNWLLRNTVLG